MKKITLTILYVVAMALLFASCASEGSTAKDESQNDTTVVPRVEVVETSNSSELTREEAKQLVDGFASLVASSPEKTFLCGFELNHGDIQAILNDSVSNGADSIYLMLGYNAEGDTFDLVICIENPVESQTRYYDFTLPCPEQCPAYLADCAAPNLSALSGNTGYGTTREVLTAFVNAASEKKAKAYCVYNTGDWSQGLYGVVCEGECDAPGDDAPYFTPCGNTSSCHQID